MNMRTTIFATFYAPALFLGRQWNVDLVSADPQLVVWPDAAYALQIHKRVDVVDGETVYTGKAESLGPIYYHPDSYVQSLEEVKTNPKGSRTLIANMEGNGWTHVIWTRWNTWPQPFDPSRIQILRRPA